MASSGKTAKGNNGTNTWVDDVRTAFHGRTMSNITGDIVGGCEIDQNKSKKDKGFKFVSRRNSLASRTLDS